MYKKFLALVLAFALLLSGCCNCNTEVFKLKQRVSQLEEQLASITVTAPTDPAPTDPAPTDPAPTNPTPTDPTVDETNNMSKLLDTLIASTKYADWLSVAECKEASLDHLLKCAKQCAEIDNSSDWAYDIADKLVSHPAATGDVVEALCGSQYYRVWYRISYANCNDSNSLLHIAKKCAGIDNSADWAYDIADELVNHPAATGDVVEALCGSKYYRVWYRISYADCNDSTSLLYIAKKCAGIDNSADWAYDIANELVNHSQFTAEIALELSQSKYTAVKNLAHHALESL